MEVFDKSYGHRKVGDSALLRLFNGGMWCGVSPQKYLKYYIPVVEFQTCFCTQYLHLCDGL